LAAAREGEGFVEVGEGQGGGDEFFEWNLLGQLLTKTAGADKKILYIRHSPMQSMIPK
jgi:hypothetical protein